MTVLSAAVRNWTAPVLRSMHARAVGAGVKILPTYFEALAQWRALVHSGVRATTALWSTPFPSDAAPHAITRSAYIGAQTSSAIFLAPYLVGALYALHPTRQFLRPLEAMTLVGDYFELLRTDLAEAGRYYPVSMLRPNDHDVAWSRIATSTTMQAAVIAGRALARERVRATPDGQRAVNFHWMDWDHDPIGEAWIALTMMLFADLYGAMQRRVIPPIVDGLRQSAPRDRTVQPRLIVEFGSGAGCCARDLRDALDWHGMNDVRMILCDTSAPMRAMMQTRFANDPRLVVRADDMRQTQLPDASADAIVIMNTLHEFSRTDRERIAAEARRVVRSGGRVVVLDSRQGGTGYDAQLKNFPADLNEPFHPDYCRTPIPDLFEDTGLRYLPKSYAPAFLAERWVFEREE